MFTNLPVYDVCDWVRAVESFGVVALERIKLKPKKVILRETWCAVEQGRKGSK